MTITYHDKYPSKQLNELVLLGSHDAAIATGGSNAMTQTKDIFYQAVNGARFFDLRVAAFKTSFMGGKVELRSYHDATKISSPTLRIDNKMKVADLSNAKHSDIKVHTTVLGVAGFGLQAMLQDAKTFLKTVGTSEFLIFKFDKSENWDLIVDTCLSEVGQDGLLYQTRDPKKRNINVMTLEQLRGKLLILFPEDAFDKIGRMRNDLYSYGFLAWRNLYSKGQRSAKSYEEYFSGFQYYGKGGVSASASGDSGKINQNKNIQDKLMQGKGDYEIKVKRNLWKGRLGRTIDSGEHNGNLNPNVVGLMYWTTTGPSNSGILKRNNKMWSDAVKEEMVNIGLQHSNKSISAMGTSSAATVVKKFMPNIIMVDYVDHMKGMTVLSMNNVKAVEVANSMEAML